MDINEVLLWAVTFIKKGACVPIRYVSVVINNAHLFTIMIAVMVYHT